MGGTAYFLGSNSYQGFYSLFDSYLGQTAAKRVYILKGGAGCGKSSFMKKLAERAELHGYTVERIFCSGDVDSLDGIRILEPAIVILDGTAPHVTEPPQVGERGFYLDLSRFYTAGIVGLSDMETEYREHYRRAYCWLHAAGEVADLHTLPSEATHALSVKAEGWVAKHIPYSARTPHILDVFTEVFTGSGIVTRFEAPEGMRTIGLSGICGSESVFLQKLYHAAYERNCNMILCHHPLRPDLLSGILFPNLKLCIMSGKGEKHLHLRKEITAIWTETERKFYCDIELQRRILLRNAEKELNLAKHSHNALEAAVHPYIDYAGISDFTEAFIRSVL